FILGCANGVLGRLLLSGWTGLLEINGFFLFACAVIIWLLFQAETDEIRSTDLAAALAFLALVALPIFSLSWVALTGPGVYMVLASKRGSPRRRAAIVLLALTVLMLWAPLIMQLFPMPILSVDAGLAALLMGTDRVGNVLGFADGSGQMVVTPECSSFSNL